MKRIKKVITVFILSLCVVLQFTAIAQAAVHNYGLLTLPAPRVEVEITHGYKANNYTYARVKLNGGTANYIYVRFLKNDAEVSNGTTKIAQNDTYTTVYYTSTVAYNDYVVAKAHQRNVANKTAAGAVIF